MQTTTICAVDAIENRSFLLTPRACHNSSTRCAADRDKVRACPVILGTSFDHNEPAAYHKRDQLLDALNNRSLVIVGDSMARQAFGVLIARLRGLDVVVDYNGHYDLTYSLLRSGSRVADALWLPLPTQKRAQ